VTKIAGSGSISQRHGSEDPDPDPPQNVIDPQHCCTVLNYIWFGSGGGSRGSETAGRATTGASGSGRNPIRHLTIFGLAQAAAVARARRRGGRLQERAGAGRGGEKEVHERRQNETGQSAL
jgi:hypothetical protein